MTRAESLGGLRQVRAVVPVSVHDQELEADLARLQIAPHFVDLPVGEPSPVVRLHQVSYSFKAHKDTGRAVAANRIAGIAGFAPSTFHAIGSRVAAEQLRRGIQLSVTNVPGPQSPLYAAGAVMEQTYPVPPLLPGHALAIGVTSYDGQVFYGVTADRDLVPDADTFARLPVARRSTSCSTPPATGDRRCPAAAPGRPRPEAVTRSTSPRPCTAGEAGAGRLLTVGDDVVLAPDDSEDAEYDALMTAAETSAVLAAELEPGERRRVVVVAEVAALAASVSLADVVAVHADADDLPNDADPEDLEDLGWYATQEISDLLG